MSILDTYLDKVYRRLRPQLDVEDLQEKAELLEKILCMELACPDCGCEFMFDGGDDDAGIQDYGNNASID